MADVSVPMGSDWLTRSHFLSEVEQPTQTGSMMAPFSGNPQMMMQMLMHPAVQEQMRQFGMSFDPSMVSQSPFFGNAFMGRHPQLGNALTSGLMGAAATPEAPMVSGAGSGISRAIQGGMGGPALQRQYQMGQMQQPFQGMAAMIPGMEFQRKQQLLGGMLQDMQSQSQIRQQLEQLRSQQLIDDATYKSAMAQLDQARAQNQMQQAQFYGDRAAMTAPKPTAGGAFMFSPGQAAQPGQPQQSPGFPGIQTPQPGRPEVPGSWNFQADPRMAARVPNTGNPQNRQLQIQKQIEDLNYKYAPYERPTPPLGPTGQPSMDQKGWDTYRQGILAQKNQELQQLQGFSAGYGGMNMMAPGMEQPSFNPGAGWQQNSAGEYLDPQGNAWTPDGQFLGPINQ